MKHTLFSALLGIVLVFSACEKKEVTTLKVINNYRGDSITVTNEATGSTYTKANDSTYYAIVYYNYDQLLVVPNINIVDIYTMHTYPHFQTRKLEKSQMLKNRKLQVDIICAEADTIGKYNPFTGEKGSNFGKVRESKFFDRAVTFEPEYRYTLTIEPNECYLTRELKEGED
ncbi:MAG: hypothetical protein MJZ82_00775 [Paludibacteraceae bacterium]|nr:hypothetical protein [Paludibacteraceae bacterium]